jgi:hypothetical protein
MATIGNSVSASNAAPTYIYSKAIPSAAKGKAGMLSLYFNMSTATNFQTGQAFDWAVYVDGTSISAGDSNTVRYRQTATNSYALSSNGYVLGTGAPLPYLPIFVPVSLAPNAANLQIGILNSSAALNVVATTYPSPTVSTIIITAGTGSYTVPSTADGQTPSGVYVYLWGAGGRNAAGGNSSIPGGAGGFTTGFYSAAPTTLIYYSLGQGASAASSGGSGGGYCGIFNSATLNSTTCIAIAGGGGGGSVNGPRSSGGGGGGTSGSVSRDLTTCANIGGFAQATQTAGASSGLTQFNGSGGGGGGQGGGGGGWFGGGPANGGSGYIVGFTSGGTTTAGSTLCGPTNFPQNILPPSASSPYYRSGYGTGNGGGALLVFVPAITGQPHSIGVKANFFVKA